MVGLAVAVVVLLPLEPDGWVHTTNLAIWMIFGVDYSARLALSKDRRQFVRTQWADLVAILPMDFLRIARVLRLVRLLRLVRTGSVLWRVSASFHGVLNTNGLAAVLAFSGALIVLGGLAIWTVEPRMGSIADAIWWSVVTTTTVGYGDLSPSTGLGRLIAATLMIVGIGTIGMITGSIATYFIADQHHDLHPHVTFLRQELARWPELTQAERERLAQLLHALAADGHNRDHAT